MSNTIHVTGRRAVPFFGTAYPGLSLDRHQQDKLLAAIITQKFCKTNGLANAVRSDYNVDRNLFVVRVGDYCDDTDPKSYRVACDVEKYFNDAPRLGLLSPPRVWHRIFSNRCPVDTYLLELCDAAKTMDWLFDNLHHRDYQMFSKFGGDISLGFKSAEHSTMFKLSQGVIN